MLFWKITNCIALNPLTPSICLWMKWIGSFLYLCQNTCLHSWEERGCVPPLITWGAILGSNQEFASQFYKDQWEGQFLGKCRVVSLNPGTKGRRKHPTRRAVCASQRCLLGLRIPARLKPTRKVVSSLLWGSRSL